MTYYVIQGMHAAICATWDEACRAYIEAKGAAVIAETVEVQLALVRTKRRLGRDRTTDTATAEVRNLLKQGMAPMRIAEHCGLSRQAVYYQRKLMIASGELS